METLPASAAAAPGMLAVDWLPLVAEVARIEPPARVGVGGESVIGVGYRWQCSTAHCGSATSACTPMGTRLEGGHRPGTVLT